MTDAEELELRRLLDRAEALCRAFSRKENCPCGFCTFDDMQEIEAAQKALDAAFMAWKKGLPR